MSKGDHDLTLRYHRTHDDASSTAPVPVSRVGPQGLVTASESTPGGSVRPSIAVVVNTLNEEKRLPTALASVYQWVDQIVVVDMHSDDRTADVARSFGADLYLHDRLGYADPARAYALSKATADWILILDADEVVPIELARTLQRVAADNKVDVVRIPMVNHLLGAKLAGTGWGPAQDRHLRFFRKGSLTATPDIHDYLRVAPGARILDLPVRETTTLVHYNYTDVSHFLEKLNRYTDIEASSALEHGQLRSPPMALIAAFREFVSRFVARRGYRDGWRGYYLAILMAGYRLVTAAKIEQLRRAGPRASIEASYERDAERLLQAHGEPAVRRAEAARRIASDRQ
jgi:glycosyltransferase involved in cell wall biosynthesis